MVKLLNQEFHSMVKLLSLVLHNKMKSLSAVASITADNLISSTKPFSQVLHHIDKNSLNTVELLSLISVSSLVRSNLRI